MKRIEQIRLFIADDHALMRAGLKHIFALVPDFVVVAEACSGNDVLAQLRQGSFDVLLLDLNMSGVSGVDLITRVKAHQPQLPILVLTMHNEPLMATRALKAGASGYITKDCEPDVLQAAIRKVAMHGNYIAPELAEKMVFSAVSKMQPLPHHQFTNRELEVFYQLIAGFSVSHIAARLSISHKTVSTHKTRLMEKLNVNSIADLMRYAIANDLLDRTPGHFVSEI
jgi:DNA-binding NarL/FixJ family response regulator